MRSRQVHLDFHTSEFIPSVAADFDPEKFADTLQAAHVDSVTCFARGHHGWLYYPSEKFPEMIHPHLQNKRLLLEQIAACHARDIEVPIYTTVQWDGYSMRHHPEWLARDPQGQPINTQDVPAPNFYDTLCLNSPYRVYFKALLLDLINVVGPEQIDGIFMDILFPVACDCQHCQAEMAARGFDHLQEQQRLAYSLQMLHDFKQEMSTLIWAQVPQAHVFYNGSHIGPSDQADLPYYSHLELESLPSGGWGYDDFPISVRYARNLGKPLIGMTGKFHTYWGDFHSLKNKPALEYECFNMLALGADGCSIGDQLHPDGRLSPAAYELIGSVYGEVAKMNRVIDSAHQPLTEIGVLTPEEFWRPGDAAPRMSREIIGVTRLLQELCYQFDIIDSKMDFSRYPVLILPDTIPYRSELAAKLQAYVEQGGHVIGSDRAMIDQSQPQQSFYGLNWLGAGEFQRDFIIPNEHYGRHLPPEEFVCYLQGSEIAATSATVLLAKVRPYFNRTGETFISHQHAPSTHVTGTPALTKFGHVYYFAHPLFTTYRKNAPQFIKEILSDVLAECLPQSLLRHDGPSTLQLTVNTNHAGTTAVIHGLHYITEKKSEDIYTIENEYPLANLTIQFYVGDQTVRQLRDVLTDQPLPFSQADGYLSVQRQLVPPHFVYEVQLAPME